MGTSLQQIRDQKKVEAEDHGEHDYTSGDSDENGAFHVPIQKLPKNELKERILFLWRLAYKKARGASIIVSKHID